MQTSVTRYAFVVPGKPQPWQRAGYKVDTGRFYTPAETAEYQDKVRRCAALAGVKPIAGLVAMSFVIVFPDDRTRDDDNVEKTIRDALQGVKRKIKGTKLVVWERAPIAFENDRQVRRVVREVLDADRKRPRVEVIIEPLVRASTRPANVLAQPEVSLSSRAVPSYIPPRNNR